MANLDIAGRHLPGTSGRSITDNSNTLNAARYLEGSQMHTQDHRINAFWSFVLVILYLAPMSLMLFLGLAVVVNGLDTRNWGPLFGMPILGISFWVLGGVAITTSKYSQKPGWFRLLGLTTLILGILCFVSVFIVDFGLI